MRNCGNCRFGQKDLQQPGQEDEEYAQHQGGACHKAPPLATAIPFPARSGGMQLQNISLWPAINLETGWCGSFETKEMQA
jgi:hypothetical protein